MTKLNIILLTLTWFMQAFTVCNAQPICDSCFVKIDQKCEDGTLYLEAKTNGTFNHWIENASQLTDKTKLLKTNPVKATVYTAVATFYGQNIVPNGNFEKGNTEFESDYNFQLSNFKNTSYCVDTDPKKYLQAYVSKKDITSGYGKMLIADGSNDNNNSVYRNILNLNKNKSYLISLWVSNIHEDFAKKDPDTSTTKATIIQILIDKNIIYTYPVPADTTWHQLQFEWLSNNSEKITFEIRSYVTSIEGNDFALDEIKFLPLHKESVTLNVQPCNYEEFISPDGDGYYDSFFIPEKGAAKIIDLNGIIVREINTPSHWDGTYYNGSLASAGYYAIVINEKIYRISVIR